MWACETTIRWPLKIKLSSISVLHDKPNRVGSERVVVVYWELAYIRGTTCRRCCWLDMAVVLWSLTSCRFTWITNTTLATSICLNGWESPSNARSIGIFITSGKQLEEVKTSVRVSRWWKRLRQHEEENFTASALCRNGGTGHFRNHVDPDPAGDADPYAVWIRKQLLKCSMKYIVSQGLWRLANSSWATRSNRNCHSCTSIYIHGVHPCWLILTGEHP